MYTCGLALLKAVAAHGQRPIDGRGEYIPLAWGLTEAPADPAMAAVAPANLPARGDMPHVGARCESRAGMSGKRPPNAEAAGEFRLPRKASGAQQIA
jgi:hypothetical protein